MSETPNDTKHCPYCAEEIRAEAVRCRYCRSHLARLDQEAWHRDHDDARFAGVASALAHGFALPVTAVRLGFVILTFVHFLGPLVYGALWLIIPRSPGKDSLFEGIAREAVVAARTCSARRASDRHRRRNHFYEEGDGQATSGRERSDEGRRAPATTPGREDDRPSMTTAGEPEPQAG